MVARGMERCRRSPYNYQHVRQQSSTTNPRRRFYASGVHAWRARCWWWQCRRAAVCRLPRPACAARVYEAVRRRSRETGEQERRGELCHEESVAQNCGGMVGSKTCPPAACREGITARRCFSPRYADARRHRSRLFCLPRPPLRRRLTVKMLARHAGRVFNEPLRQKAAERKA